jgi:anti-sigma regulatory factor (Ser/Thr protein kinase)
LREITTAPLARSCAGSAAPAVTGNRLYIDLRAHLGAVPHARRAVRQTLAAWEVGMVAADTELVTSELVANAVTASLAMAPPGALVALYLAMEDDRLSVLVWDSSPQPPVYGAPADDTAECGRGLEIVRALSERWGTVALDRGKIVWATLALTNQDRQRADESEPGARVTMSG